jgi:hypothetical protein
VASTRVHQNTPIASASGWSIIMGRRPAGVAAGLLPAEDIRPAAGPAPGRDRAMRTARVLTVRQPRASAITYAGKDVENRTWPTRYRGLLCIHAGMTVEPDDVLPPGTPVPRGAIIGHVTLTETRHHSGQTPATGTGS